MVKDRVGVTPLLVAGALCLLLAGAKGADCQTGGSGSLYQWTDDKGTVHVTDRMETVPSQYRSRTTVLPQASAGSDGSQARQAEPSPAQEASAQRDAAETEANQKEYWQHRMLDAKKRLADAEGRLQSLEQRKQAIAQQWGSSGSSLPPQEVLNQVAQIDGAIASIRQEIGSIRTEINTGIPDEARKAGVPPGWLREVQ